MPNQLARGMPAARPCWSSHEHGALPALKKDGFVLASCSASCWRESTFGYGFPYTSSSRCGHGTCCILPLQGLGEGQGAPRAAETCPGKSRFTRGSFCRRRSPTQLCVGLVLGERRSPGSSPGSSVQQERTRDEAAALLEDRSTKYHRSTALTCASSPQTKFSVAVGAVCCLPAPRREQAQAFPARLYHSGTLQKSLGCLAWAPGTNYQAC